MPTPPLTFAVGRGGRGLVGGKTEAEGRLAGCIGRSSQGGFDEGTGAAGALGGGRDGGGGGILGVVAGFGE
jgi:hypothetical protein